MILRHYLPKLRNGFPPPWSSVLWRPSETKRPKKDRLDFSEIDEIDDCLWIESRGAEQLRCWRERARRRFQGGGGQEVEREPRDQLPEKFRSPLITSPLRVTLNEDHSGASKASTLRDDGNS